MQIETGVNLAANLVHENLLIALTEMFKEIIKASNYPHFVRCSVTSPTIDNLH